MARITLQLYIFRNRNRFSWHGLGLSLGLTGNCRITVMGRKRIKNYILKQFAMTVMRKIIRMVPTVSNESQNEQDSWWVSMYLLRFSL